jgi:hypothetical protein
MLVCTPGAGVSVLLDRPADLPPPWPPASKPNAAAPPNRPAKPPNEELAAGPALLAAGLDGIEQKLALEPEMKGDMYSATGIREIPHNLREAADLLNASAMLRAAFGDDVVDHYHHAAQWEITETDRVVTDFELQRLLERA